MPSYSHGPKPKYETAIRAFATACAILAAFGMAVMVGMIAAHVTPICVG